jgi:hypothetical protein
MTATTSEYQLWLARRSLARLVLLLSALAFVLIPVWAGSGPASGKIEPWFIAGVCAMLVMVGIGAYLHSAKCPRCGNQFAVNQDTHKYNSFTLRCMTCGLALDYKQ